MRLLTILLMILLLPCTLRAPEEKDYYQLLDVSPNTQPGSAILLQKFTQKIQEAKTDPERAALVLAFQTLNDKDKKKVYDDQRVRGEIHNDPRALRLKLIELYQLDRMSLKPETFLKMIKGVQQMEKRGIQGKLNLARIERGGVVFSQPETLRYQAMRRLLAENANDFLACKPDFASLKTYWETMMTGGVFDINGVGIVIDIAVPAANEVAFFNDAHKVLLLYGRDHLDLLEIDFAWLVKKWIAKNPNAPIEEIQEWFKKYTEKYGKKSIELAKILVPESGSKSFYRLAAAVLHPEEALEFIQSEFNKKHKKNLETKVVQNYDDFKEALEIIYSREPSLRRQVEAHGGWNFFRSVDKACINAFAALSKTVVTKPLTPEE